MIESIAFLLKWFFQLRLARVFLLFEAFLLWSLQRGARLKWEVGKWSEQDTLIFNVKDLGPFSSIAAYLLHGLRQFAL